MSVQLLWGWARGSPQRHRRRRPRVAPGGLDRRRPGAGTLHRRRVHPGAPRCRRWTGWLRRAAPRSGKAHSRRTSWCIGRGGVRVSSGRRHPAPAAGRAYCIAASSRLQACSQRPPASARTRQCACIPAWRWHSSPQLLQAATHACSCGRVRLASYSVWRLTTRQRPGQVRRPPPVLAVAVDAPRQRPGSSHRRVQGCGDRYLPGELCPCRGGVLSWPGLIGGCSA
jgi:hypothetical protein